MRRDDQVNTDRKNVAILIRALDHGGAERCASNMSFDLSKYYNVHLIVFDGRERMYPYAGTLHDLNLLPRDGLFHKAVNIWKRSRAVRKIKKECHIDCCISLLDGANIVNAFSKGNEVNIVSIRNYVSARKLGIVDKLQLQYYCAKADKVVALSKTVGLDLIDNYNVKANKATVIYNSVDSERLLRLSGESLVAPFAFPYITTMGRLTRQKGHSYLLRAFTKVVEAHPELKLVILGQGEDEALLKQLTKRLGIEQNVVFPGYIKNPHNIIANSRFFVMSSVFEGLGNVILEAMACGKLVVSTDCLAGPREILAPNSDLRKTNIGLHEPEYAEYGILVPAFPNEESDFSRANLSREENVFADTMNRLLDHPDIIHQYETKSLERVGDFAAEKITDDWLRVIEEKQR